MLSAIAGKGAVDEMHDHYLGVYGLWGFPGISTTARAVAESDLALAFGVDCIRPFLSDGRDVQQRDVIQLQPAHALLADEYPSCRPIVGPVADIAGALADAVPARPQSGLVADLGDDRLATMGVSKEEASTWAAASR